MASRPSDEAFSRALNQMGIATLEQIEAAQREQVHAARSGEPISLGDVLVKQGIITAATLENIEKKLTAQQQGGLQQLGNYKLIKKLGEGGMGAVFLAEDVTMMRKVALKVLPKKYASDPNFLQRFRREAKAAGKLNHINIISAFTVGEELGNHFYVMEYCDGEPLDKQLKREQFLPWDRAIEITIQVARGLKHAHEHGIIHRDIKPANIFMASGSTPEGNVAKILDMGLSKDIGGSEQSFNTQTGVALGTPHYISPEQAKGEKSVDGRTDIYSLGATLYHLVTGRTPFDGSTAAMVIMKHLTEQLPNPQDIRVDIPDGVVQVIQRMMAKEAADRYSDCDELLADLELIIDGKSPSSIAIDVGKSSIAIRRANPLPKEKAGGSPQRRTTQSGASAKKKNPMLLIAGGVAVVGMLIFIVASLNGGSAAPQPKPQPKPPDTVAQNDPLKTAPNPAPVQPPQPNPAPVRSTTPNITQPVQQIPGDAAEFNGHRFKIYREKLKWHDAKKRCEDLGGHLATITSKDESDFVLKQCAGISGVLQIGATDEGKEGVWTWVTGEPWDFTYWKIGEPDGGKSQNYLACWANEGCRWADIIGSTEQELLAGYICEWEPAVSPPKIAATTDEPKNVVTTAGNLLINPGFESGDFNGWNNWNAQKVIMDSANIHSGKFSVRVEADIGFSQVVHGLKPGHAYVFSGWLKSDNNEPLTLIASEYGGPELAAGSIKGEFRHTALVINTDAAHTSANVGVYKKGGTKYGYIDDLELIDAGPNQIQWDANKAITLIPLVDIQKDKVHGDWSRVPEGLVVQSDGVLEFPYQPPDEYDFKFTFSRPKMREGGACQKVTSAGMVIDWWPGAWGNNFSFRGIVPDNSCRNTNFSMKDYLENGRTYTSIVQVRRDGLRAYFDGQLMGYWPSNYKDFKMDTAVSIRDKTLVALNNAAAPSSIQSAEVIEITGKGKFMRPNDPAAVEAEKKRSGVAQPEAAPPAEWISKDATYTVSSIFENYSPKPSLLSGVGGGYTGYGGVEKNWDYTFHTKNEANPFIVIDLGRPCSIDHIEVINRKGTADLQGRAHTLTAWSAPTAYGPWDEFWRVQEGKGVPEFNIKPEKPVENRYIKFGLRETNTFHLHSVKVFGRASAAVPELDLGGGQKVELLPVPAGEFLMGSNDNPEDSPAHRVRISQLFYAGKFEVTVAQFRAFVDSAKHKTESELSNKGWTVRGNDWQNASGVSWKNPGFKQTDNHPAVMITWNDAQAFCQWASKLPSLAGKWTVRLPTEAEWEYIARGTNPSVFPWGNAWDWSTSGNAADSSLRIAGYTKFGDVGQSDGFAFTAPVGSFKKAASWCGAFDLAGNVWEWCEDRWDPQYYRNSPAADPGGPQAGDYRILRGGAWNQNTQFCRSTYRGRNSPEICSSDYGFRVVVVPNK